MHLILLGRSKKANTKLSSNGVKQGNKFELRSSEQILEEFSGSSDRINFISNNSILIKLSDQTNKAL